MRDPVKAKEWRMAHPTYANDWKISHKQKGLCAECNQHAAPKSIFCANHHYRHRIIHDRKYELSHPGRNRESMLAWRQKQLAQNCCYHCGHPLIEGETKYCGFCKEY